MKKQGKFVYGATKSSVPCVQNGRISFRKYSALFIVNPFGSTTAGNLDDTSGGSRILKMDIFTGSSSKLIKHDTTPGSSLVILKCWYGRMSSSVLNLSSFSKVGCPIVCDHIYILIMVTNKNREVAFWIATDFSNLIQWRNTGSSKLFFEASETPEKTHCISET